MDKVKLAIRKAKAEEMDLDGYDKGIGITPLMNAILNRDYKGACALIDAGADMTLPNSKG